MISYFRLTGTKWLLFLLLASRCSPLGYETHDHYKEVGKPKSRLQATFFIISRAHANVLFFIKR